MVLSTFNLTLLSQTRLFATRNSAASNTSTTVPLSITDAIAVQFTPTQASWFFEAHATIPAPETIDLLTRSLQRTIDEEFPQWTGSLSFAPYEPKSRHHTKRFGRLQLRHGGHPDENKYPGVELAIAESPLSMADVVESPRERHRRDVWDVQSIPSKELFTTTPLALQDAEHWEGLPVVSIQMTVFKGDGGIALGVKIAHPVADAETLMVFMNVWAGVNRRMSSASIPEIPLQKPVFDPSLLAQRAAGEIDGEEEAEEFSQKASDLPLARFDYWSPTTDIPKWAETASRIPKELAGSKTAPPGKRIPWETWDRDSPCGKLMFHFTKTEIDSMVAIAQAGAGSPPVISHHTSILAFVWICLSYARSLSPDNNIKGRVTTSTLTQSLSLRSRVYPRLPKTFLGSALTHADATIPTHPVTERFLVDRDARLQEACLALNASTQPYADPEVIAALLHHLYFCDSPLRYWDCFLGEQHCISTSWCRLGLYEVNFFGKGGGNIRYVEPTVSAMNGIVVTSDGGPLSKVDAGSRAGHWTDAGVDVLICARSGVLKALVDNIEILKSFR